MAPRVEAGGGAVAPVEGKAGSGYGVSVCALDVHVCMGQMARAIMRKKSKTISIMVSNFKLYYKTGIKIDP